MKTPRSTIGIVAFVGLYALSSLASAKGPSAADVKSIDSIISAYYEVISGPSGYQYDAARDQNLHAPNALITRVSDGMPLQRHDLLTEQQPLKAPYPEGFFEYEIGRIVQVYEGIAHVWSTYEIRKAPSSEVTGRGVNSISLYYDESRWWIASWSTQLEGKVPLPAKYLSK